MTDTKPTADEMVCCTGARICTGTWPDDFRIYIIFLGPPPWGDWRAAVADIKRKEAARAD